MTDRIRDPIPLSPQQVKALREATHNNTGNYPAGYALVHGWIKDNPAAQADGTVFWFEQARGINQNDSLSASFIRRHTENGLDLANVPLSERKPMQVLSNLIAKRVTSDLLDKGKVLPLAEIIDKDIQVALNDGSVPLGGWGGSFYYYDLPFNPRKPDGSAQAGDFPRKADGSYYTVGDEIDRLGQRELLLNTSAKTIKDMVIADEIRMQDAPQLLETSWNAGMPASMKAQVTLRATHMLAEHLIEQGQEQLRSIPAEVDRMLEQQRKNLLDGAKDQLDDVLKPSLPRIPRISGAEPDAQRWQQLADQLDTALANDRRLAHGREPLAPPSAASGLPAGFAPALHIKHDLREPDQPGHAAYAKALDAVRRMEARQNIASGEHSEVLAARLTAEAAERKQGITHVEMGRDGQIQVIERHYAFDEGRRFSVDASEAMSQSVAQSSARWLDARSLHYRADQPSAIRTEAQSLALSRLNPVDQAMFSVIRSKAPAQIGDDTVAQAMAEAKRNGIYDVSRMGDVTLLGNGLYVLGTTAGFRGAVDVTGPAPPLTQSMAVSESQNQERQQQLAQAQQQEQDRVQGQARSLS